MTTPADTIRNPPTGFPNRYVEVIRNDGDARWPIISLAWEGIWSLLRDRQAHTRSECMAAVPEVRLQVVKSLLYFAHALEAVEAVNTTRLEEVAPDLFVVRTVRGYRTRGHRHDG